MNWGAILSKKDLKTWVKKDYDSYNMEHPFVSRVTFDENWELFSYMRNLRYVEYYTNKKIKLPWDNVLKWYYWTKHRRNCKKIGIFISPNSVGPGFHLVHRGFRHILGDAKIGTNCEILPLVLIGKKRPDLKEWQITIGDNCYISTGVTILGPVEIGNDVTIAAGAVVIDDVPDKCIVAGVPAKIVSNR